MFWHRSREENTKGSAPQSVRSDNESGQEAERKRKSSLKKLARKAAVVVVAASIAVSSLVYYESDRSRVPIVTPAQVTNIHIPPYSGDRKTAFAESDKAMAVLMSSYNPKTGLWNGVYWWQSADILMTVINNAEETHNTKYLWVIENTYAQNSGNFINQYRDDEGWWALTWIKAYDLTHQEKFLNTAKTIFNDMAKNWSNVCGGGITRISGENSKGAISNELFLEVALLLHQRTPGDTKYLDWAYKEYNWFMGSGLYNQSKNLVDDQLTNNCTGVSQVNFTYTQGEMINALVDFYKVTNNTFYLRQAEAIANANDSYNVNRKGILEEKTCAQGTLCYADMADFEGMYINALYYLYTVDHKNVYLNFIEKNAKSVWSDDRNKGDQIGVFWSGPVAYQSPASQSSGIAVIDASEALSHPQSKESPK